MPLLRGVDVNNVGRPILVDSLGQVLLAATSPSSLLVGDHGWDGSAWQKLQVDASNRLKVLIDAITAALAVTQTNPALLQVGLNGFDGLLWKKLNVDASANLGTYDTLVLNQLDVKTSTLAKESGGNLEGVKTQADKLQFDASDRLKVLIDAITAALTVTQTTPANLLSGVHGYISGAWRKQPLVFSYSTNYLERVFTLSAAVGANTLTLTAVPANTLRVITNLTAFNNTSPTTFTDVDTGAGSPLLAVVGALTARMPLIWSGWVFMAAGQACRGYFEGCTLNDDLYLDAVGYDMTLNL